MKKIDQLLVKSFLPPFVATFFIALFVLVMQALWLYIDEIAGKGVGFFLLIELVAYMSVSMVPLALPIAVLISSVMVLGNLAEDYELSSMKSAGVPLIRIMASLIVVAIGISTLSFFIANNLIPVSNLKFKSRLYDIRRSKPTLNMEEGLFNDDFQGYAIRLGKKEPDNRSIRDVLIYDHSAGATSNLSAIAADSGQMYSSGERYFIMELFDGAQYVESSPKQKEGKYPFVRTEFGSWTKVFDLSEFDLDRTDEDLFKSNHAMLSARQLGVAIDSIDRKSVERVENMATNIERYYQLYNSKNRYAVNYRQPKTTLRDTTPEYQPSVETLRTVKKLQGNRRPTNVGATPLQQSIDRPITDYDNLLETFPKFKRGDLANKAHAGVASLHSQIKSMTRSLDKSYESRVKHVFELHSKFSLAVACLLFLFIGAPMGAIVRKGGFGYPLLIAILFFMLFMVLSVFSKNIAERGVIHPVLSAWLPIIVLVPIGAWLTYLAMIDAKITFFDKVKNAWRSLTARLGRKDAPATDTPPVG